VSSTEPRTAVVNVLVVKPLQIGEPDWCRGHRDDRADFKTDISHDGPEHVIAPGGREMFRACLTQAPYSNVDRRIGLYIEVADITGARTPDEVEQLAADLEAAATELRALGRQLAAILTGGEGR
jgi:hypothetical protein